MACEQHKMAVRARPSGNWIIGGGPPTLRDTELPVQALDADAVVLNLQVHCFGNLQVHCFSNLSFDAAVGEPHALRTPIAKPKDCSLDSCMAHTPQL